MPKRTRDLGASELARDLARLNGEEEEESCQLGLIQGHCMLVAKYLQPHFKGKFMSHFHNWMKMKAKRIAQSKISDQELQYLFSTFINMLSESEGEKYSVPDFLFSTSFFDLARWANVQLGDRYYRYVVIGAASKLATKKRTCDKEAVLLLRRLTQAYIDKKCRRAPAAVTSEAIPQNDDLTIVDVNGPTLIPISRNETAPASAATVVINCDNMTSVAEIEESGGDPVMIEIPNGAPANVQEPPIQIQQFKEIIVITIDDDNYEGMPRNEPQPVPASLSLAVTDLEVPLACNAVTVMTTSPNQEEEHETDKENALDLPKKKRVKRMLHWQNTSNCNGEVPLHPAVVENITSPPEGPEIVVDEDLEVQLNLDIHGGGANGEEVPQEQERDLEPPLLHAIAPAEIPIRIKIEPGFVEEVPPGLGEVAPPGHPEFENAQFPPPVGEDEDMVAESEVFGEERDFATFKIELNFPLCEVGRGLNSDEYFHRPRRGQESIREKHEKAELEAQKQKADWKSKTVAFAKMQICRTNSSPEMEYNIRSFQEKMNLILADQEKEMPPGMTKLEEIDPDYKSMENDLVQTVVNLQSKSGVNHEWISHLELFGKRTEMERGFKLGHMDFYAVISALANEKLIMKVPMVVASRVVAEVNGIATGMINTCKRGYELLLGSSFDMDKEELLMCHEPDEGDGSKQPKRRKCNVDSPAVHSEVISEPPQHSKVGRSGMSRSVGVEWTPEERGIPNTPEWRGVHIVLGATPSPALFVTPRTNDGAGNRSFSMAPE